MSTHFDWTCPHCGRAQVVTEANYSEHTGQLYVGKNILGDPGYRIQAIGCLNNSCRNVTLFCAIHQRDPRASSLWIAGAEIRSWRLLPDTLAKPQPEYIPKAMRDDYTEACRIRELSPKSSATLARRCLQGMIRDFCGISRSRLIDEIDALRDSLEKGGAARGVTHESVDAIDHVRRIGNIGAHMEADVNLIIDIDPDEAQVLIELIEMLFEEWYVERHVRGERLARIAAIGADKDAQKAGAVTPQKKI